MKFFNVHKNWVQVINEASQQLSVFPCIPKKFNKSALQKPFSTTCELIKLENIISEHEIKQKNF